MKWWRVLRQRRRTRYRFHDFVYDSWALHYARKCHEEGDDVAAQRWLDRIRMEPGSYPLRKRVP